jgi:hypothetical protein
MLEYQSKSQHEFHALVRDKRLDLPWLLRNGVACAPVSAPLLFEILKCSLWLRSWVVLKAVE